MNGDPLTCVKAAVSVSEVETDVTARGKSAYPVYVRDRTEQMLTKRRAVDFCRVAASLCRMA